MKIHILGFSWLPELLPKNQSPSLAFEKMEQAAGNLVSANYSVGAVKDGEWWKGFVIHIRDSKTFTKQKKENGTLVFSAEELPDGEKLAEINFFVAHESNGHGLYSYHHQSSSLTHGFGYIAKKLFKKGLDEKKRELLSQNQHGPYSKATKELKKSLRGSLALVQVIKPGTFEDHISQLKAIRSLDAHLVSFELKDPGFSPLIQVAKRNKISLAFDTKLNPHSIIKTIKELYCEKKFLSAIVSGDDENGNEQIYRTNNDPAVFSEWDFDETVKSEKIVFNDIPGSINESHTLEKLKILASNPKNKKLLGIV